MLLRERGFLCFVHVMAACLLGITAAEERSILTGATVESAVTRINSAEWDASALIDGGFYTPITQAEDPTLGQNGAFIIRLSDAAEIKTVFIQGLSSSDSSKSAKMGTMRIFSSNDL